MRLFLSLDGPALAHVNSKALCVLHRQSELKIRDVKDIFTRFKKKPAEEIIAHLLGEQYKAGKYFRRLLPDSPKKKNNIKCHEVWFAHTKRGGRESGNFLAFMNSPFTTYDFSCPPGKKSAPTKPAEKTSASTYTSKSQESREAVRKEKKQRGKVERENKQLAKKAAVLAALPFVAVAAAHAEARRAQEAGLGSSRTEGRASGATAGSTGSRRGSTGSRGSRSSRCRHVRSRRERVRAVQRTN
jgi:hypothetical protein